MQPLQYYLRDPAAKDNSITHAAAARSNLDAAITMRSAETELQSRTTRNGVRNCSFKTGSRRQSDKKTILKHFSKRIFLTGKLQAQKSRKSADKSISQPWCSHSNTIYDVQLQKRIVIVLRMQPRCQATLTQPLYNVFCSIKSQTCTYLCTWQHQMTTIMQPFQCNMPPQIQETHKTTHTGATTCCRTQRRNQFATETIPAAPAAHTRYLSSPPALATWHGKTQGFVLRLPPQNIAHATFMQQFQCDLPPTASRNAKKYAHRNNHSLQNTEEEPIRGRKDPSRNRRTHEVRRLIVWS